MDKKPPPAYPSHLLPCEQPDGSLSLVLIARRTYAITPAERVLQPLPAADQPGVLLQDRCDEGQPSEAPVTLESDLVPCKPRVDVFVVGKAVAPGGQPLPKWQVQLRIGRRAVSLQVLGPRRVLWQLPRKHKEGDPLPLPTFTEPEPIAELPLSLRHAYGGQTWYVLPQKDRDLAAQVRAAMAAEAGPGPAPVAHTDPDFGKREVHGTGTAVLDLAELQAEMARSAPTRKPATGEQREVAEDTDVLTDDGQDSTWSEDLAADLAGQDAKTKQERQAAWLAQRAAEDAVLAEHPRLTCPTNPYGKGFCVSLEPLVLKRLVLPQLEDPNQPLTPQTLVQDILQLDRAPLPAATTALPRASQPRFGSFGVLPSAQGQVAGLVAERQAGLDLNDPEQVRELEALQQLQPPKRLEPGFFCSAAVPMQWSELRGDEEVELTGVDPKGPLQFALPNARLAAVLLRGNGQERLPLRLDTVVVEPQLRQVSLTWRVAFQLPSWDALAEYPMLQAHVEELDARTAEALAQPDRDHEGTRFLPAATEPGEHPPELAAQMAPLTDDEGVLLLPRMGSYLQAEEGVWRDDLAPMGQPAQDHLLLRQQEEAAALANLAAADTAVKARQAEIAKAILARKPVPPLAKPLVAGRRPS